GGSAQAAARQAGPLEHSGIPCAARESAPLRAARRSPALTQLFQAGRQPERTARHAQGTDGEIDQGASVRIEAVDHVVVRRGTGVQPLQAGLEGQTGVLELQQHAWRIARVVLVVGGLERITARWAEEI